MSKQLTKPCETCPYRRDVPAAFWSEVEFQKVLAGEASFFGAVFACHKQIALDDGRQALCAGFVLDQKKRGVPSIALRVMLRKPDVAEMFDKVEPPDGVEMFDDAIEMCRVNLERIEAGDVADPELAARHLTQLRRRKRKRR